MEILCDFLPGIENVALDISTVSLFHVAHLKRIWLDPHLKVCCARAKQYRIDSNVRRLLERTKYRICCKFGSPICMSLCLTKRATFGLQGDQSCSPSEMPQLSLQPQLTRAEDLLRVWVCQDAPLGLPRKIMESPLVRMKLFWGSKPRLLDGAV